MKTFTDYVEEIFERAEEEDERDKPDRNVVQQARKAVNMNGKDVTFHDGKTHHVTRQHANKFLQKHTTSDRDSKLSMQTHAQQSHKNFMSHVEEVETVDEISKNTAASYISKASRDVYDKGQRQGSANAIAGAGGSHPDQEYETGPERKAAKRVGGIDKATKRLMKKEEISDVEEKLVGDQHKLDHNKDKKIDGQDMKMVRKHGAVKQSNPDNYKPFNKEEIVTELDKKTMGSYIKKAVHDRNTEKMDQGTAKDIFNKKPGQKVPSHATDDMHMGSRYNEPHSKHGNRNVATIKNREQGIKRATAKLTREDNMDIYIDEISKSTLGSYINKATKQSGNLTKQGYSKSDFSKDREPFKQKRAHLAKIDKADSREKGIAKAVNKLTYAEHVAKVMSSLITTGK